MSKNSRRTFAQSTVQFARLSVLLGAVLTGAACSGQNPNYVEKPASCGAATPEQLEVYCATGAGDAGAGDAATADAGATDLPPTCPVTVGQKTTGFAFHVDQSLCPGMASLPVNGQVTSDTSSVWTNVAGKSVAFVSQPSSTLTSTDWTLQPGNKPVPNQETSRWYAVDATTTSIYSALAAGTNPVGFNRVYASSTLQTVTNGKCPDNNMLGFCFPWQ